MICASCNSTVPKDSIFCLACGSLQDDAHEEVIRAYVDELVEKATGAYEEKNFEQAINLFSRVLEADPADEEVRQWLLDLKDEYKAISDVIGKARELLNERKYQEAQEAAQRALELAPGYQEAEDVTADVHRSITELDDALSSGKAYLETNRYEQAIERLRIASEIDPFSNDVVQLRRDAERMLTAWEQELDRLEKLRQAGSFEEAISFAEGMLLRRPFDKELRKIIEDTRSAVQTLEESRLAGDKAIVEQRWADAKLEWQRVLRILPGDKEAREKRDKAVVQDEKARAVRRRSYIKYGSIGAVGLIILIIVVIGLSNRSRLEYGKKFLQLGEPEKALEEFNRTGSLFVSDDDLAKLKKEATYQIYLSRGNTARDAKEWEEAKKEYNEAALYCADRAEVDKLIALVDGFRELENAYWLADDGDYSKAIDTANAVLMTQSAVGDHPQADVLFSRVREALRVFSETWLENARKLLTAGKYLAASVEIRKIASKCPADTKVPKIMALCRAEWLKQAETHRKEGKWDSALVEYQRMNVSFPNDTEITRQIQTTMVKRELQRADMLFKQKQYHSARNAALEARNAAKGVAGLEGEVASMLSTIDSAVKQKYDQHMAEARRLVKAKKYEEAKVALEQAMLYKQTDETKALLQLSVDCLNTPEGMVYVPEGPCIIGDSEQEFWKREAPAHEVSLPAYYVDRHPVTNAQYMEFVKAAKHRMPAHWVAAGNRMPPGRKDHPVTHVSIEDARAYAKWANKRLPKEVEWEKAARGAKGLIYPWGAEYETGMANDESQGKGDTTPVGTYPDGKSPCGCLDMAGNVWEWTDTNFHLYPGCKDTLTPGDEKLIVIKGGCFMDDKMFLRSSFRETVHPASEYACRATLGFRCVADVKR